MELPILGWKRSETELNRPLTCNLGRFWGLSGRFLHLIAQTMRRRSTPRSRLRRRRIAEFELAKPRIHPADEAAGAVFVSVTQSFNTATSMGRLTLHMLLSFAQFEREVTAERIRDKIAASKRKGLWMGGRGARSVSSSARWGRGRRFGLGHARLSPAIQRGTGYPQRLAGFRGLSNPSRQLLGRRHQSFSSLSRGFRGIPRSSEAFFGSRASFPPKRDDASGAHSHARVP